jgi:hypothetical protein
MSLYGILNIAKPLVEAAGGVKQLKTALKWSEWYAVKWWREVYGELGLQAVRDGLFARALFVSLKLRGYVDGRGRVGRRPEKPEYPTNSYAVEFVEFHESFDKLGAVNVAANKIDEATLSILYSAQ